MKRVTRKRVIALILTVLMVATLLPMNYFIGGALTAKADGDVELVLTSNMITDIPSAATAKDIDDAGIFTAMGGYRSGDKKAGVVSAPSGYGFSESLVVAVASGGIAIGQKSITDTTAQVVNALRVNVSVKSDITVIFAKKKNGSESSKMEFGLYTIDASNKLNTLDNNLKYTCAEVCTAYTKTFTNVEAGTYYMGFASDGGYISSVKISPVSTTPAAGEAPVISSVTAAENNTDGYAIDVTWETSKTGSGDGMTCVQVSSDDGSTWSDISSVAYSADKKVTYKPTASGTYKFRAYGYLQTATDDDKAKAVTAGQSFTYVLPLAVPTSVKAATMSTSGTVKVSWNAVSEADSYTVTVYDGSQTVNTISDITGTSTEISGLTNGTEYGFTVKAVRTGTNAVTSGESDKATATPAEPKVFTGLYANSLEISKNVGGTDKSPTVVDSNWSFISGTGTISIEDKSSAPKTSDGYIFTKAIKLAGKGSTDGSTSLNVIKLDITEASYITIYAHANNATASKELVIYDGNKKTDIKHITVYGTDTALSPSVAVNLEKGTYYLYSSGSGVLVYGISLAAGTAPRNNWSDVAAPVLSNASGANGKITVDLSAEFGTNGGDYAIVTLYNSNGNEVSSEKVAVSGTVEFSPSENGNYTVKAVLSRSGEADKESNAVSINNFIKPVDTPTITWLRNLGGGSVYVDWDNVVCDSYKVEYKKSSEDNYTTAVDSTTAGNYTLESLTSGEKYTVRITASKSGLPSGVATAEVTVGEPTQQWYAAAVGSATSGSVTINGSKTSLTTNAGQVDVSAPNSGTTASFEDVSNGKIADSEDGFFYYYTKINPNTENFTLTATFKVDDITGIDNQSGFGIYAVDKVGLLSKDAKYMNSVSVGNFKASNGKYHQNMSRLTTGYTSCNTQDSGDRNLNNGNIFSKQSADDKLAVGDTFTYTLEKTNDSYIASMAGADGTIVWEGTGCLAVQEDGSLCIGVVCARQVGVTVSNITFSKSDGQLSSATVSKTVPTFTVHSSKVTANTAYTFYASSNVNGTLKLYQGDDLKDTINVTAGKAVSKDLTLVMGDNVLKYVFTPASDASYANTDEISGSMTVTCKTIGEEDGTIVVSPSGTKDGLGTADSPLDLQTALNSVSAGQTIVLRNGTYYPTSDYVVPRNISGTADKPITITAQTAGGVTINGKKMSSSNGLMTVVGSYIHVYGINFCNSPGKGFAVCGNNNTIELCQFYNNKNTGLQISRYSGEPNDKSLWPSYNLIKNCDAYDNCDTGRNDADGFAAKLTCGEGNVFYGCTSHNNIDDGWDLFAKSTTGPIGVVTIENCVAYSNGWLTTENPAVVGYGEGNGFKLGGENMYGAHILKNCVSYNNAGKGITSNSGPDCQVYDCTVYNNSLKKDTYNVSLYTKTSNEKAWKLSGVISIATNGTTAAELGASNGVMYSLRSSTNYLFDGTGSYNSEGVQATTDWFENVNVNTKITRDADGTLNMHGLLVLNSSAPANSGARINTSSDAASKQPDIDVVLPSEPEPDSEAGSSGGNVNNGSSNNGSSGSDDDTDDITGGYTYDETTGNSVTTTDNGLTVIGEQIAVSVSSGTVIKNAAGQVVSAGNVYVKAAENNEESRSRIESAMKNNNLTFSRLAQVEYYEVSFVDANGNSLTLDGSMNVTFKFPEGANATDYAYKVLHLLKNGTLDVIDPVVTDKGITVTVTEFSPFAIVYVKQEQNEGKDSGADMIVTAPGTGDNVPVIPYLMLMAFAVMVAFGCDAAKKEKLRRQ